MTSTVFSVLLAIVALSGCSANCPGQAELLDNPADPLEYGPYKAVEHTLRGGFAGERNLTISVWLPERGEVGGRPCRWDVRQFLPAEQGDKLPEGRCEGQPVGTCCRPDNTYSNCWQDAFSDPTRRGRHPLHVFIHGTGGFRTNSANIVHKWVSRGSIVVAADYPGITLKDLISLAT